MTGEDHVAGHRPAGRCRRCDRPRGGGRRRRCPRGSPKRRRRRRCRSGPAGRPAWAPGLRRGRSARHQPSDLPTRRLDRRREATTLDGLHPARIAPGQGIDAQTRNAGQQQPAFEPGAGALRNAGEGPGAPKGAGPTASPSLPRYGVICRSGLPGLTQRQAAGEGRQAEEADQRQLAAGGGQAGRSRSRRWRPSGRPAVGRLAGISLGRSRSGLGLGRGGVSYRLVDATWESSIAPPSSAVTSEATISPWSLEWYSMVTWLPAESDSGVWLPVSRMKLFWPSSVWMTSDVGVAETTVPVTLCESSWAASDARSEQGDDGERDQQSVLGHGLLLVSWLRLISGRRSVRRPAVSPFHPWWTVIRS